MDVPFSPLIASIPLPLALISPIAIMPPMSIAPSPERTCIPSPLPADMIWSFVPIPCTDTSPPPLSISRPLPPRPNTPSDIADRDVAARRRQIEPVRANADYGIQILDENFPALGPGVDTAFGAARDIPAADALDRDCAARRSRIDPGVGGRVDIRCGDQRDHRVPGPGVRADTLVAQSHHPLSRRCHRHQCLLHKCRYFRPSPCRRCCQW